MTIKLQTGALLACVVGLAWAVGCGGDDDNPPDGNAGEGGATAGSTSGGRGGSTPTGGRAGSTGMSGAGGEGNEPSVGGAGAGGAEPIGIYDPNRPIEPIPVDKSGNLDTGGADTFTLTADKTWHLIGKVFVPEGVTLTIEPGTLIVGSPKPNAGSLFIMRGAQIVADGTAENPIVFSSEDYHFHPNAPWGGLVILGRAPIGQSMKGQIAPERAFEGLTDPRTTYGGTDAADGSGSMSYVRIEYGGDIIAAEKEINGLSFCGVGTGTSIHHIMVKRQMDDCFEWFGGTMDADHLICENAGDDMFDTDEKFVGHLQFLFGRLTRPGTSADPNGFEWDGNQPNFSTDVPERGTPHAANATVCGLGYSGAAVGYGAVLRRGLLAGTSLINIIVSGFNNGVDTRDRVDDQATPTPAPLISWTNSLFFGNLNTTSQVSSEELVMVTTPAANNDNGFNEQAWIDAPTNENDSMSPAPAGFDCYADPPHPFPDEAVSGGTPAAPFDDAAEYVGAFQDADDNWMTGAWVDWSSGDL